MKEDNGQKRQRTFHVEDEKITTKSYFSHRKMGFIIDINGDKFFNNGSTNGKWSLHEVYGDWRSIAEGRCLKKWLDKKFNKKGE